MIKIDTHEMWYTEVAKAAAERGGADGTTEAMNRLRDDAYGRVPRDTGHLADTGTVTGEGTEAVLSYDTVYAKVLHAHPEWNFQGGRDAHWLESAVDSMRGSFEGTIASEMRKYF